MCYRGILFLRLLAAAGQVAVVGFALWTEPDAERAMLTAFAVVVSVAFGANCAGALYGLRPLKQSRE